MSPTLRDGDVVLVRFGAKVQAGDVVLVRWPDRPGQLSVKRAARPAEDGCRVVAVAEPSVIRAALVYALKAPLGTYWNIDVRSLSTISVAGRPGRWSLRLESVSAQPLRA